MKPKNLDSVSRIALSVKDTKLWLEFLPDSTLCGLTEKQFLKNI